MYKLHLIFTSFAFVCLASILSVPALASTVQGSIYKLEKVVELSRHTVRPPTSISKEEKATARTWDKWLVPGGHATGHGYAAAVDQGRYLISQFRNDGLNLSNCPNGQSVYALADTDQRTRMTAKALLGGMFPGCGLSTHSQPLGDQDPAFGAILSPFAKLNSKMARKQINEALGTSPEKARERYLPQLKSLENVVCKKREECPFYEEKWAIKENKYGIPYVTGLSSAASLEETILMQYANNNPWTNVGFGHVRTAEDVKKLSYLHYLSYKVSVYPPYIAKRGGSEMMSLIMSALASGSDIRVKSPTGVAPGKKLLLLVGHDSNIAFLRAMLNRSWNVKWHFKNYAKNDPSPIATLLFERFKNTVNGKEYASVKFVVQSLNQLRYLENINAKNPPFHKSFAIGDNCKKTPKGYMCPLNSVINAIQSSIDQSAVIKYPFKKVVVDQ
ncbi:MAG: histidine-type phosphatase [Gammaproteobacteria bacterium]